MIESHLEQTPLAIRQSAIGPMLAFLPSAKAVSVRTATNRFKAANRISGTDIPAHMGRNSNIVATIDLFGIVSQRETLLTQLFGGILLEKLQQGLRSLATNPRVQAIVLNIDSPGGEVAAVDETAALIRQIRANKRIIAVANSEMGSAAYWIGSAASEIAITPGGEIGSIGIVAVHTDISAAERKAGIKRTIVRAGKYKWEGHPYAPLNESATSELQAGVDRYYDMFTAAVARNRGTTQSAVKNGYGQGRMVGAAEAVKLGLADRVATLEQVLADLGARR